MAVCTRLFVRGCVHVVVCLTGRHTSSSGVVMYFFFSFIFFKIHIIRHNP